MPMKKVLVANRGEIALRVIRACRALGLKTVAVYSTADATSAHVREADRSVCIGPPPPSASYLNRPALLEVARATGCDALHPGYGFLSENAGFARACQEAGLIFVGPDPDAIRVMGDKAEARRHAMRLEVPCVPGSKESGLAFAEAQAAATTVGYPLLLKAAAGGGGRGMRVVPAPELLREMYDQARAEAKSAFGDDSIYMERFFQRVRHIEIQVFGDRHGTCIHLGERDCSVQRRHQKLVEEGPSPVLDDAARAAMGAAAVKLAAGTAYVSAGTVEFIYDLVSHEFFFIEMNTRIQVEHPVTEALTGVDLVQEQLRVAAGERLSFGQGVRRGAGHAIEWRINAEDPDLNFRPSPGPVDVWRPPHGADIRLDSHVYEGYRIPPFYDSLMGKLIVTGRNRQEALATSRAALDAFEVDGVRTTIPFYRNLLNEPDFISGNLHTRWVDERMKG
ncbi:MAG: acetyl-CoA carboxylase biotin carboxylase subunit [Alphaproteobacteria bacterium]|nr:acetyl-CoA carboxylase biotin carboxylase subunit [Alphaproteobacteria bacterium]